MKKRYLIFFSIILFLQKSFAQDIHFSQYFSTPLTISPSNTGNYVGDYRVMGNFRTQWKEVAKPYTTESIGGDKNFYIRNEKISAGLLIINDKSGGNLQVNKIQASLAWHKTLGKNTFHIGIQPGLTLKNINSNETFPDQFDWNSGQFNGTMPNNETNLTYRLHYFDLNWGVGYDRKLTSKVEVFISYAMFHVNSPKETFLSNSNTLAPRNVLSLGTTWYALPKITIQPSLCMMGTDKASEFLFGSRFFYSLDKDYSINKAVFVGVYGRQGFANLTDAFFAVLGANWKNYYTGISYDFNISQLKTASNYRGAFEVSFIYTGLSTRLIKSQIPCDRY
ncbi:MAG TPA: PorP/SprF family type IX secretion system membrane protein [Bacteroidia bacterium]|nr:PorP/SprF family type IX secretion system membrane protein [Bacteroidia bacterium]